MVFSRVLMMRIVRDYSGLVACGKVVFSRVVLMVLSRIVMLEIIREYRGLVGRWSPPGW